MPILAMRVRVHRNPVTRVTDLLERLKAPENCQRMFGFWNMLEHVGTCWNMLEHCSLFGARSHNSHVRRVWPVEVA